jgi:hypothetical protein
MIGKLKKITGSPAATVDYIFMAKGGGGMRGQLLGGTLLEVTPKDISGVLCALRARRPDVRHAMHHAWASCPEDEVLGSEQWLHVGECLADKLGWQIWVAVRHSDTAHDHVHFVGSRIGWDGSCSREQLRDWRLVRAGHARVRKHPPSPAHTNPRTK